ncbi:hypothetical protein N7V09_18785 [Shewanella seohaensis]|uniref:hypothetical protein n=1 Tax=Shewanella seohaensis TaxID=755175 RepID=UPI00200C49EC|nr:hypothetical protein [Shewanella seohaensis]MCL1119084.1 hypothetical protein [Shewanella seohaensis]UXM81707.1 hypothetical protein N7V09_18785 [Shewanella seohaensis]
MNPQHEPSFYDLHRLITWLIVGAALLSATGVIIALYAEYQVVGTAALFMRADFLGDYINSPLAYVFNLGLLAAGICMLLSMAGLYLLKLDSFSQYIALTGAWVGTSVILMGIFPINFLTMHRLVSTSYLLSTLTLHALVIIAGIMPKLICPRPLFYLSLFSFISAVCLSLQLDWSQLDFPPCETDNQFCFVAANMWLQTNLNIIWCLSLAFAMRRLSKILYYRAQVHHPF